MNNIKLMLLIQNAISEVTNLAESSQYYELDTEPLSSTVKVLIFLSKEVQNNPESIDQRVLRAMHDLGMAAYKEFEKTSLEIAINEVIEMLYNEVPIYKNLTPLRGEFGKGNPV